MATARRSELISLVSISSGFSDPTSTEEVPRATTETLGGGTNHRLAFSESRRMSKDYERLCKTSQAMVYVVMSRLKC